MNKLRAEKKKKIEFTEKLLLCPESTVDFNSLGPIGRSFVSSRFFHLIIIFGLTLNLIAAFAMLSSLLRISLRIASVVLAFACNTCPVSLVSMDYCLHNIHHNSPGSNNYLPQRGSKRFLENQKIVEKAREVYHKSRGPYGSPRIHASLHRLGIQCSRPRVARLIDLFRNRIKCHLKDGVMIFDRITGDEKKFRHLTGMNHHSPLFFKILNLKGINFLKSATDLIRRTRKELTEYFSC